MTAPMLCVTAHLADGFARWARHVGVFAAQCNRDWFAIYSTDDYRLACHWLNFQGVDYVSFPV